MFGASEITTLTRSSSHLHGALVDPMRPIRSEVHAVHYSYGGVHMVAVLECGRIAWNLGQISDQPQKT